MRTSRALPRMYFPSGFSLGFEGEAKAMEDPPRRLVGHSRRPLQLSRCQPTEVGHPFGRPEPDREPYASPVQDGSGGDGALAVADVAAEVARSLLQPVIPALAAFPAAKALGPAQLCEPIGAGVVVEIEGVHAAAANADAGRLHRTGATCGVPPVGAGCAFYRDSSAIAVGIATPTGRVELPPPRSRRSRGRSAAGRVRVDEQSGVVVSPPGPGVAYARGSTSSSGVHLRQPEDPPSGPSIRSPCGIRDGGTRRWSWRTARASSGRVNPTLPREALRSVACANCWNPRRSRIAARRARLRQLVKPPQRGDARVKIAVRRGG